jgi:hypothetical protein
MLRMMMVTAGLAIGAATHAAAQTVSPVALEFHGDRVTLHAQDAPIPEVLAEWGRIGGITVVNAGPLAGRTVTLDLTDVPERRALDLVLRGVAGYLLAQRAEGAPGKSAFGRLIVLPTSSAPVNPATASTPIVTGGPRPVTIPPILAARYAELGVEGKQVKRESTPMGDPRRGPMTLPPPPAPPKPEPEDAGSAAR